MRGCALVLAVILGGCPASGPGGHDTLEEVGPGAQRQTLVLSARGPRGAPARGRVLVLGFGDDAVQDGRPSGRPSFLWWSGEGHRTWPLEVAPLLPARTHLLVVADADGDRRPDEDELSSGLILDFEPGDAPRALALERPMSTLGTPPPPPPVSVVLDTSKIPDPGRDAALLLAAYLPEDLDGGAVVPGARPIYLRVEDPAPLRPEVRLEVRLPPPRLRLVAAVDLDGDYLVSESDPVAAPADPRGRPLRFVFP